MYNFRSLQNVNLVFLIGSILVCLVFIFQVKQIYSNNQKCNRYSGYKQYVNEISTLLKSVENSVNKSSMFVHQLNEILYKHREKESKDIFIP